MEEITKHYKENDIFMVNCPILDMDPEDLIKKGNKAS